MTYYGLLCDDITVKKQMLYLRNITHANNDDGLAYLDAFLYPQLFNQVGSVPEEIDSFSPKFSFDNANDIVTIRTNYSYIDDTVIQIDGGEERGSGHSQAQGYFLYALGEPFLDYEQVPYEDDVRAETWKNGISLQNTAQVVEGTLGTYSQDCGNAPLNQYYGMRDCPLLGSYPDYRQFPLEYGGDVEDYIGTADASFAGAYVWRPYENADPVREYFVKFGDVLAKRTIVSNNVEGEVYHNFINIYDEFSESRTGSNLTFSRDGRNLDIDVIDSTVPLTLAGGDSGINYCFSKTSCSSSYRGAGTYRRTYLHASTADIDFILGHHWYLDGQRLSLERAGVLDKGVSYGDQAIIFDADGDGLTSYDGIVVDGWALATTTGREDVGAFNVTTITVDGDPLFSSSIPVSVFIDRSEERIVLTVNSMTRSIGIDYPQEVTIAFNAAYLANNSGFSIVDEDDVAVAIDSEAGTTVTFTVTPGQNSGSYTITGSAAVDAAPLVTQDAPGLFFSSDDASAVLFSCSARDDALVMSMSILINSSGAISALASATPAAESFTLNASDTFAVGTYSWACSAVDDTGHETLTSYRPFTIEGEYVPPPSPPPGDDSSGSSPGGGSLAGSSTGGSADVENESDNLSLQKTMSATFVATDEPQAPIIPIDEVGVKPVVEQPTLTTGSIGEKPLLFLRFALLLTVGVFVLVSIYVLPRRSR